MDNQSLLKDIYITDTEISARQIVLSGKVQGVGFRPFIYRLATEYQLTGWVKNCVGLVEIHVQGNPQSIRCFLDDIFTKKPPVADPKLESADQTEIEDFDKFEILPSSSQGEAHISVPTDLFLCDDCLAELNDPSDRRYHYPFINCTQCGPRYTLIQQLPYDRPNTTMAKFQLCEHCLAEYEDPSNRRFHAEPIACAVCGPSLSFHCDELVVNDNKKALQHTVDALRDGKVIAIKGIGGYHLICYAGNTAAITRLRNKKYRPHKPLAIMFPAPVDKPFKYVERAVVLSEDDKAYLLKPSRPILLVKKGEHTALSQQIAPGLNEVGIMLPYSPLHHLLLNEFGGPIVATSANISGEPVLIDNEEVEKRLSHVADAFLHHDRAIVRPADDPVYRTIAGQPRPIRIGRGTAPMELELPFELEQAVLAVGSQMKNVITLAWKNRVVISPHIGEMDSARSIDVFESTINDLQALYEVKAQSIICDKHPSYTTTRWANQQNLPMHRVYHHHAHASSAYYECETNEEVIAFTWDGVGYGEDGTLWGGETFLGKPGQWRRLASMRPFNVIGGDKVAREPWRSAAALCWETGYAHDGLPEKDSLLEKAWQKNVNASQTTSVGRLFDAAAALIDVRKTASFEGQAPMELEALYEKQYERSNDYIKLELEDKEGFLVTDWEPLIATMLDSKLSITARASLFHTTMAQVILQQANTIRSKHDVDTVCLSGGVFQNRALTEYAMTLLSLNGFNVILPALIPVNDAAISFGQVMEYGFKR